MTNFEFLKQYEQLQYTIMFDSLVDLGFAVVSYCRGDKAAFWNHALTDQTLTEGQLTVIEENLGEQGRRPAIYFENADRLKTLALFLESHGYKRDFRDSWMWHSGTDLDLSKSENVHKVENEQELQTFLTVFNACYQKDDPQNVYGELGDYLSVAEAVWHKHHKIDRLEYFVVYKDALPVAVSTLTSFRNIGYISNVGSLQEVRGQGFGKLATLYCVEQSKRRGNTTHCLATEEGTYANKFYSHIGFVTKFTAVCYKKNE
ncbi:MAG: GNAT family N-acetyltransferase [bacterium]|nr:GNAT family N-acetyltransferase [bacterium]